jgi:hypothetical protein
MLFLIIKLFFIKIYELALFIDEYFLRGILPFSINECQSDLLGDEG